MEGQLPQTSKQHPVPQNIMEVEFKLIGDLTIRQFGFVAVSGVIAFLIYKSILPAIFRWPLAIGSVALGLGMAFLPVKDRGLDKWILSFFNSIYSPTQRVWHKEPPPPAYLLADYEHMVKSEIISLAPIKSRRKLEEFLKALPAEEAPTKLDLKEEEFIKGLNFEASVPESLRVQAVPIELEKPPAKAPLPEAVPGIGIEEIIRELPAVPPEKPKAPPTPKIEPVTSIAPKRTIVPKEMKLASEINFSERPVFNIFTPEAKRQFIPAIKTITPGRRLTALPSLSGEIVIPIRGEKVVPSFEEVERTRREALERVERREAASGISLLQELKATAERARQHLQTTGIQETVPAKEAAEEKMLAGKESERIQDQIRMLTERVKELQKQAEEKKDAADIEKTITYYQKQIAQLQKQNEALRGSREAGEEKVVPQANYQKQVEEIQKEVQKILAEIQKARKEIENLQGKIGEEPGKRGEYEERLQKEKSKLAELEEQRVLNMETITRILREIKKLRQPLPPLAVASTEEKLAEKKEKAIREEGIPNIISGVVEDAQGKLLEGIVILVRDRNNDPVRALKTNKLGQFSITTPLPNGEYNIEVGSGGKQFDIIRLILNGSVLKPLRIVEK